MFQVDDPKLVLREIKKLQPLNYNQFYWWRRFTTKTKPLPNNASFFDKIKNGDYEASHLYWQAKYCEMEINEKIEECNNDRQKFLEKHSVDLARRKKLWEDF